MLPSFERTVYALAESIARERCPNTPDGGLEARRSVARFLLEQQRRMPDYLRLPMRCLTLAFDASALPFTGRSFHALPHEARLRQIRAWRGSRLGVRRDLIRFYEGLTIFAWYAEAYGEQ